MIGVCGLWCFIVGYALVKKDLGVSMPFRASLWRDSPHCITVRARLTMMEAQLFERLAEGVLA